MTQHTDAFYEIEFQRMFKTQGETLRQIRLRKKQLACYLNKREEIKENGWDCDSINNRIDLTNARLAKYNDTYEQIEDYKAEISINNPANAQRAADAKIIEDAYERAYGGACAMPPATGGIFARLVDKICSRQK